MMQYASLSIQLRANLRNEILKWRVYPSNYANFGTHNITPPILHICAEQARYYGVIAHL